MSQEKIEKSKKNIEKLLKEMKQKYKNFSICQLETEHKNIHA
jgi:hypothetical protein